MTKTISTKQNLLGNGTAVFRIKPVPGKFGKGQTWKARGGWRVELLYVFRDAFLATTGVLAVHHNPDRKAWSPFEVIVTHDKDGKALTGFAVDQPPSWGGHPADLVERITVRKKAGR